MRTKYYLLSVVAFVVAFMGLALLPSPAQAQEVNIDKECSPNPVQLGQEIECIIEVTILPGQFFQGIIGDFFPEELTVTNVDEEGGSSDCSEVADNVVACVFSGTDNEEGTTVRAIITATAQQCGTFPNTATTFGLVLPVIGEGLFFTEDDTEQITVEGCEVPPAPEPGQQQPNQQQGEPAPITQDFEQESESGEIDQTFEVS